MVTEVDGVVIITLPVPANWVPWANICGALLTAIGPAGTALSIFWIGVHMMQMKPLEFPPKLIHFILSYTALAVFSGLIAVHSLTKHLRWGQVASTLTVTQECIILTWLGFRRMREHRWQPDEIISVDLRKIKDVFTFNEVYRVRIRFRRGLRRILVIPAKDAPIAEQIHDVLHRWWVQGNRPGCISGASRITSDSSPPLQ